MQSVTILSLDEGFLQFESLRHRGSYITADVKTRGLLSISDSKDISNHDNYFILRPKHLVRSELW